MRHETTSAPRHRLLALVVVAVAALAAMFAQAPAAKGKDDIRALDEMRDKINCGPGFDTVLADKIDKSCEDVTQR